MICKFYNYSGIDLIIAPNGEDKKSVFEWYQKEFGQCEINELKEIDGNEEIYVDVCQDELNKITPEELKSKKYKYFNHELFKKVTLFETVKHNYPKDIQVIASSET